MEIVRSSDTDVVIIPSGRIDMSNSHILKDKLLELFVEGYKTIWVDFANVTAIDSSGLGKLLLFQKKLGEKDGELIIKNVNNDYIKKMFQMIHLDKAIKIE